MEREKSLANRQKFKTERAAAISDAMDNAKRRNLAHGRSLDKPTVTQNQRAANEMASKKMRQKQKPYKHDSDAYKRRESPMDAVNKAMTKGRVDGVNIK